MRVGSFLDFLERAMSMASGTYIADSSGTTLQGSDGNDTITSDASEIFISLGSGDDSLDNSGSNVSIVGGEGNDSITNVGDNVLFNYTSGDGNDMIVGFNTTSTLQIGDGKDTFSSIASGSDIIVKIGEGSVTLKDAATLSAVNIKGGNVKMDEQLNIPQNRDTVVTGTALDDVVNNYANKASINGDDGSDILRTVRKTSNVKLFGGAGDDILEAATGSNNLLDGGEGNDDIYSESKNSTLLGGAGNDAIENYGNTVTINGGAGDDSIINEGENVLFISSKTGDGNDVIEGFNATSSLKVGNGSSDTYNSTIIGNDVIITVGQSKTTLVGAAKTFDTINVLGTWQPLTLKIVTDKDKSPVTVDSIIETIDASARTSAVKITGNENGNVIIGGSGKNTLYGEAGDDYITGGKSADKIDGGDGDDTLAGGAGADTLTGGAGKDVFVYTAGKDVITDYVAGEDIVSLGAVTLADVDFSKATVSGSDVKLTVGSTVLTIKNGKSKEITFVDAVGTELETVIGGLMVYDSMKSPITVDDKYEYVDAASYRTKAVQITGNANDNVILGGSGKNTIYGGEGNDSIVGGKTADSLFGDEGDDTLAGGAGNDTLTGGDGKDVFVHTAGKDVIADYQAGEDVISLGAAFADFTSTMNGKDVILTNGSNQLTIKDAKSREISFIDATGEEMDTVFGALIVRDSMKSPVTVSDDYEYVDATKRTKAVKIIGNALDNVILGGSNKNTLEGGEGDDTLVGGKINDTLTGGDGADVFVYTAGKDVITDYSFAEGDTISLGATFDDITKATVSGSNVVLTLGTGNTLTIKGGKARVLNFVDSTGEELETVFGGYVVYDSMKSPVEVPDAYEYVDAASYRKKAVKITGNANDNVILGGSGKNTIYGGDGADSIVGGKLADNLYGDADDDTLAGGAGNDTLTGGKGKDVFVYTAGNDVITDYNASDDVISLGDSITFGDINATTSGADVILTIGSNKLTIKDGKSKEITFVDAVGTELETVVGGLIVYDSMKSPVTVSGEYEYVDATKRTKAVQITGNANDNVILGGSGKNTIYGEAGDDYIAGGKLADKLDGGDGDDTLAGGAGNDTLTGGEGNDTFIYESGKDTITDYAVGDVISIGAAKDAITIDDSGKTDIVFTLGTNSSLTVKNARGKLWNAVDIDGNSLNPDLLVLTNKDDTKQDLSGTKYKAIDATARTLDVSITANNYNNTIYGGMGKNIIDGQKGNDYIEGDKGDDSLYGGSGNDTLLGNVGNDYLEGNANDDVLFGGEGNDSLLGGAGHDVLRGEDGNDYLFGDTGNDALYGDEGADLIEGGVGNDTLWGGKGNDTLLGGDGADTFIYNVGDGKDTILNFTDDDFLFILDSEGNYVAVDGDFKNNTATFKVGNSSITLNGVTSSQTFNINDKEYMVEGTKIVEKDPFN